MERKIICTEEDFLNHLWKLNKEIVAVDTETTDLKYDRLKLTGISLCDGTYNFYIPIGLEGNDKTKLSLIADYIEEVKTVICHNWVFDAKVLYKYGIDLRKNKKFDTLIAHHLIDENDKHGLKHLTRTILDREVSDYDEKLSHYDKKFYEYALDDTLNTWLLYQHLKPQIESDNKLKNLFYNIEMPFQDVLLEMEIEGVLIDQPLLKQQQEILREEILNLETKLYEELGESYSLQVTLLDNKYTVIGNINFNSSKQLADILFNRLGLDIIEHTDGGQPKTGTVTISKYRDHPFVALLEKYKIASKLYEAFVSPDGQIATNLQKDGKVRPNFKDFGTKTGRLACIAEGTKIQTVRDFSKESEGKNIEDIKPGDLVYCSDKYGSLVTRKVKRLINNGIQECVKLKWGSLSNKFGGELICTPDHKIKTLDGKWTRADEVGITSLSEIGYNRRVGNNCVPLNKRAYSLHFQIEDYAFIYYPGMKKVKNIRYITDAPNVAPGSHIHHKDGNKLNDSIENLEIMTPIEHCRLHSHKGNGFTKESQAKAQETLRDMRLRGDIKYNTPVKCLSYDYCMKIAHKYKGMIKYIIKGEHHDFLTIKREMDRHSIVLKDIKKLYEETNHYFIGRDNVGERQVYDLEIDSDDMYDTHNFFANEICVHNCTQPNLQQLPKPKSYAPVNVRELFIAPEGYNMFSCDYSGQEVAVAAQVSKDPTLVKSLNNGYDMHLAIANQFYNLGIPEEALSKKHKDYKKYKEQHSKKRSQAKVITFGLMYGKGAYGFSKDFGISEDEAQKIVDDYFAGMPKLKESIDKAHKEIDEKGFVTNLAGRKRHFFKNEQGYYPGFAYRQSFNFLIQGFSADMIRAAAVNVSRRNTNKEWDLKPIMTIHDEFVYICKDKYVKEATELVKKAFEDVCKNFVVPVTADIEIGKNYGDSK